MKVKIEIEVSVDDDWLDFILNGDDVFRSNFCGYWLNGVLHDKNLGWLVHEHSNEDLFAGESAKLPEFPEAVNAWKEGKELPTGWYRLNKDAAIKSFVEGYKRYGSDWNNHSESTMDDLVIQLALLGEIRYG